MSYLVIGRPKRDRVLPKRHEFLKLVVKEWETVLEHKKHGRIRDVFGFRDGNGGIIITELRSEGEVEGMVRELPLYRYADWEILPMMSAEEGLETARRKAEVSLREHDGV